MARPETRKRLKEAEYRFVAWLMGRPGTRKTLKEAGCILRTTVYSIAVPVPVAM
jgi:hypothetical protein